MTKCPNSQQLLHTYQPKKENKNNLKFFMCRTLNMFKKQNKKKMLCQQILWPNQILTKKGWQKIEFLILKIYFSSFF